MGLERRGNRFYYYRKRRKGRTVVSEYVAGGAEAELLTQLETLYREREEAARADEMRRISEQCAAGEDAIRALITANRTMLKAAFLTNDYHTHKRQWRRIRRIAAIG